MRGNSNTLIRLNNDTKHLENYFTHNLYKLTRGGGGGGGGAQPLVSL